MTRLGLRAKLLIAMFLIIGVAIGLVASQAVLLFQEDKSSYIFDLNASRAIKISDEIQTNARHLTEKMLIFAGAARLQPPAGTDLRAVLNSMLDQYRELLLFSVRGEDGTLRNVFQSPALAKIGLSLQTLHAAYIAGGVPFDSLPAGRPFLTRLGLKSQIPTFTLAVRGPAESGGPAVAGGPADAGGASASGAAAPAAARGPVLVAEIPLDRLYASRAESRLFEVYVTDAAGKPIVSFVDGHEIAAPGADGKGTPGFADLLPKTARTAGTREYALSGVPMLAAYSPVGDLGLWAVVQIPKARAFEAARRLVTRSLIIAGVVCLAALALVFVFASSITRSLVALMRATEQIGQGQFDVSVEAAGGGEIGALGARFKRMTEELQAREGALKEANRRLMESEKMTALGQLGAGIAHEVKNPMTSIRGYAQLGLRKVPADSPLAEYFQTIEKETGRSLEILKNLLRFSRQETAEMSLIDLNAVVTDTVKLVSHQLGMKKVSVISELCEEPLPVIGNANQIEQVLLNLMMNAGDAMEGGGSVTVTTGRAGSASARIVVADTGSGIPPEVLGRIFEPFFTTKPVGKGTGLGLSVSYGIVKEHKGEITVQSQRGQGTTFTIVIPISEAAPSAAPRAAAGGEKRVRVINLR
ncbi:MAG TPA: ATP-binding protein [Candidatus Polarisedimenticolia bacterium]|nr:ATP-binding protein [Candidatus Polarisedimenticolia bacterium]